VIAPRFGAFVLTTFLGPAVYAQQTSLRIDVHAIEVSANVRDAQGRVPQDLKPEDFILLEDGIRQRIISVEAAHPSAEPQKRASQQIVIFIQQSLATTPGLRLAVTSLAGEAARLTEIGEVEVVTDVPSPHQLLSPTRDATRLRGFLEKLGSEITGEEELIGIRRSFLIGLTNSTPTTDEVDAMARNDQARVLVRREWLALHARQNAMLAWFNRYPRSETGDVRAMLFVTDGFDLNPTPFYALDASEFNSTAESDDVARALAAQGWTIVSLAMASRVNRSTAFQSQSRDRTGPGPVTPVLQSTANPINFAPLVPLSKLAEASGGTVATDASKIAGLVSDLGQRVIVTYQVDRPIDDRVRRIEIRPVRAGLTVHAQKWVGSGASEAMADATAATLATVLAEGEAIDQGRLPVTCTIKLGENAGGIRNSEIEVHVDPEPIRELIEQGTLRVTLAVSEPKTKPFTTTRWIKALDPAAEDGWTCVLAVRHRDNARIAVVAMEGMTGTWGACKVR
jgi:VWFA-related protein